jgi:hypothetical protein
MSRGFGFRAGLFPWAIGLPLFALAIVQLVLELRGKHQGGGVRADPEESEVELPTHVMYRRTASIAGWIIGFFVAIWLLSVTMAVPVTTLLYLKISAGEKWPVSLLYTAGLWLLIYGLFVYTLQLPFPEGLLWHWVG